MSAYCSNRNYPYHPLECRRNPGVLKVLTCKSIHMYIMKKQFHCISQRFSLPQLQEKIAFSFIFSTIIFSSKLVYGKHQPKRRSQGGQKYSLVVFSTSQFSYLAPYLCSEEGLLGMEAGGGGRDITLGLNMKTGNLPEYMFLHINSFGFFLRSLFHELLHRLCVFIKFLLSHSTWSWAFFFQTYK